MYNLFDDYFFKKNRLHKKFSRKHLSICRDKWHINEYKWRDWHKWQVYISLLVYKESY